MKSKISTLDKIAMLLFIILVTMMSVLVIYHKKNSIPHDQNRSETHSIAVNGKINFVN